MTFQKLNLHDLLLKTVAKLGYAQTTEIQSLAIPAINEGKDIVALAQTGTGKTATYLLPILDKLIKLPVENRKNLYQKPRVLILVPTRELAHQVQQACIKYGSQMEMLKSIVITGGVPFHRHKHKLNSNIDIIIGTPGRILDYINRKKINFSNLDFFVLDEADRMLDMGFSKDVLKIIDSIPKDTQALLFSATINNTVKNLYTRFMKSPEIIKTSHSDHKNEKIIQKFLYVKNLIEKSKALDEIIRESSIDQSIIFTSTKASAEQLATQLLKKGYEADALHGNMRQGIRNKVLKKFKNKDIRFLVGTDIVGRGIDVQSVSHVINYDIPKEPQDYVHRIGRTGRAGSSGKAITLIYTKEFMQHKKIEEYIGYKLEDLELDGFHTRSPIELAAAKNKGFKRRRRPRRRYA